MWRRVARTVTCRRWAHGGSYKQWHELGLDEQQRFARDFVENYRAQYPGSKTNVSLRGLTLNMEEHGDAPAVFGIFYNDIWRLRQQREAALYGAGQRVPAGSAVREHGRFAHESFHDLLVEIESAE
ncbi:AGL213Wp [Eremothecium gossypii ATCC 10895]|uniref:AGL213Wp n=1 Tax=Eremothecium gossypii (strain ATCC 10895 / CBS 109.51 / FGSC 9923 / NRRL Y-1056) TaxID=284811 RepID=Q751B9_EREGS|nr:AGL213Wp [Eremothecium gossypii ATCC 10895]AAS54278.1 AGL213Wp [Eremothecium gossypii ATCC 10895]AEY98604.1 FAGL213Wp [Eremothecium gossypii FDAG1]